MLSPFDYGFSFYKNMKKGCRFKEIAFKIHLFGLEDIAPKLCWREKQEIYENILLDLKK